MSSDDTRADTVETPADRVATAVLEVPGVAGLHGGVLGEVATYLPGRRVAGVRLGDGETWVHVVLAWGAPVAATADAVRRKVAKLAPGAVHVTVEDVADVEDGEAS